MKTIDVKKQANLIGGGKRTQQKPKPKGSCEVADWFK